MSAIIAITGAMDPEMEAIVGLLDACEIQIRRVPATVDGKPVHAGNAYRADPVTVPDGSVVWRIECEPRDIVGAAAVVVIDHHRPGDPGYGRPPAEFLAASSIGQVISHLAQLTGGITPSQLCQHVVLTAAADHCLGAAYRGECPGVDPDAMMVWRAESRAAFQGRPVDDILADVAAAQEAIRSAALVVLHRDGDREVVAADMRRPVPVRELPEAAMRVDAAYISGPLLGPDGRCKITCSGRAEHVRAFLGVWAPAEGLIDTYGDPARGFAGGYLP